MFRGRQANPCSNKYTYAKYIEHCQKLHKERLAKMKPAIDNSTPKKPSHFKNNRKRQQLMEDRFTKIERENRHLLEKMSHIMQKKTLDNENMSWQYGKSLNKSFRKRELQRITRENQNILRRIQQSEPNYNQAAWEEERKKHEQYMRNICEYPIQQGKTTKGGKRKGRKQNKQGKSALGRDSRIEHSRSGIIPSLSSEYKREANERLGRSVSSSETDFITAAPMATKNTELAPLV